MEESNRLKRPGEKREEKTRANVGVIGWRTAGVVGGSTGVIAGGGVGLTQMSPAYGEDGAVRACWKTAAEAAETMICRFCADRMICRAVGGTAVAVVWAEYVGGGCCGA